MSEEQLFRIDFSEAKTIHNLPEHIQSIQTNTSTGIDNIWGFSASEEHNNKSGPCALGTLLYFHDIGWNHLPKRQNGRPVNAPYIAEITRWSESPDLPGDTLGTSPATMLKSLRKAGLTANWYAANTFEATMQLIQSELQEERPVIVLLKRRPLEKPRLLEWQVVFKLAGQAVHTKHCEYEDAEKAWPMSQFKECLHMEPAELCCSVITARRD